VIDFEILESQEKKVGKENELDKKSESLAHQKNLSLKMSLRKNLLQRPI
jgi:hypothetical protein